jgi:hypothetical protein
VTVPFSVAVAWPNTVNAGRHDKTINMPIRKTNLLIKLSIMALPLMKLSGGELLRNSLGSVTTFNEVTRTLRPSRQTDIES